MDEKENVVGRTRSFLVSHLLHSLGPLADPPPHSLSPPRLMRLVEDDLTAVCTHVCECMCVNRRVNSPDTIQYGATTVSSSITIIKMSNVISLSTEVGERLPVI